MSFNEKLMINLRNLSKIQKNGKITKSINGLISLEHYNGYFGSVKRFFFGDSRLHSISEINSIINETISCITSLVNINKNMIQSSNQYNQTQKIIEMILTELDNALGGINNLKFTYKFDENISTQLDILILKSKTFINDTRSEINFNKKED